MKESALSFFKSVQSISVKLNTKVEGLKSNIEEGVDILKTVAYDIKSEITQREKPSFQIVGSHAMKYLILLINQAAVELKQMNKYLVYETQAQFKAEVQSTEEIETDAQESAQNRVHGDCAEARDGGVGRGREPIGDRA
jgi:hypothetical protein